MAVTNLHPRGSYSIVDVILPGEIITGVIAHNASVAPRPGKVLFVANTNLAAGSHPSGLQFNDDCTLLLDPR